MWSAREALADAGHNPPYSLARDAFGYRQSRIPTRVDGTDTEVSLLAWAKLKSYESFDVNVILVGIESFTTALFVEVDQALHRVREVMSAEGIGVRYVHRMKVDVADANGLDTITSTAETQTLIESVFTETARLDLVVPAAWSVPNVLGRSAEPGPCADEKGDKSSPATCFGLSIPSDVSGITTSGRTAAHEVGHALGLEHENTTPSNLMCQTGSAASPQWMQINLTDDQVDSASGHCMVSKFSLEGGGGF